MAGGSAVQAPNSSLRPLHYTVVIAPAAGRRPRHCQRIVGNYVLPAGFPRGAGSRYGPEATIQGHPLLLVAPIIFLIFLEMKGVPYAAPLLYAVHEPGQSCHPGSPPRCQRWFESGISSPCAEVIAPFPAC